MDPIRKPCASENFHSGRQGFTVRAVVIHIIDGSQAACDATFAGASALHASAHYSVGKSGEIHQYVAESDTAFHAGRILQPTWALLKRSDGSFVNPNFYTIGVEHEARAGDEWPQTMYDASAELLAGIAVRHGLNPLEHPRNVAMHREIFAGKSCPGFKLDLQKLLDLANQRISGVAPPAPAPVVPGPTPLTILHNVKIRIGSPTLTAPVQAILPAGTPGIVSTRDVEGDAVNGNKKWFEIAPNEFIWSGATVP
jgi:hypothetical protein